MGLNTSIQEKNLEGVILSLMRELAALTSAQAPSSTNGPHSIHGKFMVAAKGDILLTRQKLERWIAHYKRTLYMLKNQPAPMLAA